MILIFKLAFCLILLLHLVLADYQYEVPTPTLQALKPKGFRAYVPGDPRIKLIVFDGWILETSKNDSSKDETVAQLWGFGMKQQNHDGWVFEDHNVVFKFGQKIRYQVFISIGNPVIDMVNSKEATLKLGGYATPYRIFVVETLEDPIEHGPHCPKTATKVRGAVVCAGQVIFEDNFDTFRDDLWQIEHHIPIDHPEHPFVSYQRPVMFDTDPNVIVENGNLRIIPKLQEDLLKSKNASILSGKLDLTSGCTGNLCTLQAAGVNILPPVVSGRLTSARFAFTYGNVHVRAKLPRGDWIYPEILLEPLAKKYGTLNYASGVLKIVLSRGNVVTNSHRHSIKEISGGPIINAKCRSALEFYHKAIDEGFWSDDFHNFTLSWTPEHLSLDVDGVNFGYYIPGATGLKSWLPASCRGPWYDLLKTGGPMAPFDDHFQITLGVAVGGILEFPDGLISNDKPKPWLNRGRKASLSFWQDRDNWYPTWTDPALVIDYVKVVALQ